MENRNSAAQTLYGGPNQRDAAILQTPKSKPLRLSRHDLTLECFHTSQGKLQAKNEHTRGVMEEFRYVFDSNGRLLKVLRNGVWAEEYSYNALGQRVTQKSAGQHSISNGRLLYDEQGRLQQAGDVRFSYDRNGALARRAISHEAAQYFYGDDTMLDAVQLPGRVEIVYEYDEANPISPARRFKCGVLSMEYFWRKDEVGMPLLASCRDYEYQTRYNFSYTSKGVLDGVSIAPLFNSPIKGGWCSTDYLAELVRQERQERLHKFLGKNGITLFCGADQAGTPKTFSAAMRGGLIKKLDYDSFGNLLADSRPDLFVPIGFAGGLLDRDTALVRFGWRDYDPSVGRFTAPDPLGDTGGDHDLYDYCIDDPVSMRDPSGLLPVPLLVALGVKGLALATGLGVPYAAAGAVDAFNGTLVDYSMDDMVASPYYYGRVRESMANNGGDRSADRPSARSGVLDVAPKVAAISGISTAGGIAATGAAVTGVSVPPALAAVGNIYNNVATRIGVSLDGNKWGEFVKRVVAVMNGCLVPMSSTPVSTAARIGVAAREIYDRNIKQGKDK